MAGIIVKGFPLCTEIKVCIIFGEKLGSSRHFYMDAFEGLGNDFTELDFTKHNGGATYIFADGHSEFLKYVIT